MLFLAADFSRDFGYELCLRCGRCHTERIDTLDDFYELRRRRYAYPQGYSQQFQDLNHPQRREQIVHSLRLKPRSEPA